MTDTGTGSTEPYEGHFEALLETAPDAMLAVTEDGVIALVNAQAEAVFGYLRSEMLGQPVELLVPAALRSGHPDHRAAYFQQPVTRPMGAGMELTARRKDGTEFPAEISLSAIRTGGGLLVSAAIRDVTERKRAEAKFRGLLEAAPDAVLGVDPAGHIVLVNGQAERLFGYPREELVGQPIELLVPEASRGRHPQHRTRYVHDPVHRPMGAGMSLAGRRKDGTTFPAEISLSSIGTDEGLLVSAAVRDVTDRIEAQAERARLRALAEREHLEGQLQQSQRLESLGQLAGGVAHDFNNLLSVISNYASFVTEEIEAASGKPGGERWEQVRKDMAQISRATERATELTHQLLAFGRREVVRPQTLDLNDVVTDVQPILHRLLGEHLELRMVLAPDLWQVTVDPGQIEQVLVNLAVNARDAMPGVGQLTLLTRNVLVDSAYVLTHPDARPGAFVRLECADTGTGMFPEVRARAFEPFFTTKPKGEGSGLGLATVYGIISQAGGHTEIYSEPAHGTTVRILLPVAEEVAVPAAPPAQTSVAGGRETILLVEDEEAIREVTRRILGRRGYSVRAAASGEQAIALLKDGPDEHVDLLLTDVIMPRMLGREVAERVRELRPDIRVLYMSGYAQPVLSSAGRLDPGVRLVEKPFSETELLTAVRDVLDEV